ncbi:hypothetical protein [Hymenobacter glaciei]|uniref:hypothetical protein n=1 Tax=Hymenobacter glaciei TaxID=877209 RepID=UPI0031E8CF34
MKAPYLLLVVCSWLVSCTPQHRAAAVKPDLRFPECDDCSELEKLYYFADTSFTRHDSLFIVNKRLDTTVVETGIFTYLQQGFPVCIPDKLISLLKHGIQAESNGNQAQATSYYRAAIGFYQDDWQKRKLGFDNGGISDLNEYYAANVNISILVSHAFEKLGRLPEAISTLAPFLANVEAENSKIQLRYIQLCIQHHGKVATKQALDASGKTVHRLPKAQPENDRWRVNVFGAGLGVADFSTDALSPQQAQALIRQQPYYALVK